MDSEYIKQLEDRIEILQGTITEWKRPAGTTEIIDALIKDKKKNILEYSKSLIDNNIEMEYSIFLKNVCTIKFDPGRRTGKSSAIKKLCEKYKSIVIVNHINSINFFSNCTTISNLHTFMLGRICDYEIIFIDDILQDVNYIKRYDIVIEEIIKNARGFWTGHQEKFPIILMT